MSKGKAPLLDHTITSEVTWKDLGLDARILKALTKLGFQYPTLIQASAVPLACQGKDILARARTGSGKTLAYCLPIIQRILTAENNKYRALILLPTPELCAQTERILHQLSRYCRKEVTTCDLDNLPAALQIKELKNQHAILISTPATLLPHIAAKRVNLQNVNALVVDEADLMLTSEAHLREILKELPKVYQGYLLSATLNPATDKLKQLLLHTPVTLKLAEEDNKNLAEYYLSCSPEERYATLYTLLRLDMLGTRVLIFVNTPSELFKLALFLRRFDFSTGLLDSKLPYNSRRALIDRFNSGGIRCLIATDDSLDVDEEGTVDTKPEESDEESGEESGEESDDDKDEESSEEEQEVKKEDEGESEEEDDDDEIEELDVNNDEDNDGGEDDDGEGEGAEDSDEEEAKPKVSKSKQKKGKKRRLEEAIENQKEAEAAASKYGVTRGLDFQNVSTVVNFDFPQGTSNYIHRVGRTARANARGQAITLVTPGNNEARNTLEKIRNKKLKPFNLDPKLPATFYYRCSSVLNSISKIQIKKFKKLSIQESFLQSEKLKDYFASHENDLKIIQASVNNLKKRTHARGSHLHDLAVLPTYMEQDLRDVLTKEEIRNARSDEQKNVIRKDKKLASQKKDKNRNLYKKKFATPNVDPLKCLATKKHHKRQKREPAERIPDSRVTKIEF